MRNSVLMIATLALSLAGCGAEERQGDRHLQASTALTGPAFLDRVPVAPTLFYLDGKDSCRHQPSSQEIANGHFGPWAVQFAAQVQASTAATGIEPDYLLGCLPLLGSPGLVSYTFVHQEGAQVDTGTLAVDEFLTMTRRIVLAAAGPVDIASHSYGAWIAMKLVAALPDVSNLATLLTIDAISPIDCTPMTGISDYLTTGEVRRCNAAPTDIAAQTRTLIKTHTHQWLNFYETANAYLHSSAIPEATANTAMPFAPVGIFTGLESEDNPHLFVATAARTWADFLGK